MGFFKKLFFGADEKETKLEKEFKENIKAGADYSCANTDNSLTCNGCGQIIDQGMPKMLKNNGRLLYFHKRCYKAMCRGQLPKPLLVEEKEEVTQKE